MKKIILFILLILIAVPCSAMNDIHDPDLVSLWRFEGSMADTKRKNDLQSAASYHYYSTTGVYDGGTYSWDVDNAQSRLLYVTAANVSSDMPGKTASSITFIIRCQFGTLDNYMGMGSMWDGSERSWALSTEITTNKLRFCVYGAAQECLLSDNAVSTGKNYFIAVVYDHSDQGFYRYIYNETDTVEVENDDTDTFAQTMVSSAPNLNIGYMAGSSTYEFDDGYIDEIAIFKRALTPDEIYAWRNGNYVGHYTKGPETALPGTAADLSNPIADSVAWGADDNDYETQTRVTGSLYGVFNFQKETENESEYITMTWKGKSDEDCATQTAYLQIYDDDTDNAWDAGDSDSTTAAGTEFYLNSEDTTVADYWTGGDETHRYFTGRMYQVGANNDVLSGEAAWIHTGVAIISAMSLNVTGGAIPMFNGPNSRAFGGFVR